jgi:hypothetical protein
LDLEITLTVHGIFDTDIQKSRRKAQITARRVWNEPPTQRRYILLNKLPRIDGFYGAGSDYAIEMRYCQAAADHHKIPRDSELRV